MNNYYQSIFFGCFLLIVFVSNASAQLKDEGKLNTWTTRIVQRNHNDPAECLSNVRVAKNKGFDRIVFEFNGGLNSYTLSYLPSNLDSEGEKITIAGQVFMNIDLFGTPCESWNYPEGRLKFPLVQQMTGGVFEGIQNYQIGLKMKNSYRVLELKNPQRLVIDFKH